jgi:hypothetical protein
VQSIPDASVSSRGDRAGVAALAADTPWPRTAAEPSTMRWHPAARYVAGIQAAILAMSLALYPALGLSVAWRTALPQALGVGVLFGAWAFYAWSRRAGTGAIADTLLGTILILLCTHVAGPAQYAGVALGRPLADPWLARADATLGIHVPALTAWTAQSPLLTRVLIVSYFTLLPQLVLPLVGLGLVYRDRERLWEYVFHFHVCAAITIAGVALFPAACAFSHYGFTSLIDQTRFISHFDALRAGTFGEVRFDDIEGMISFPSFHVAGAMMVTWAFRRHRWWLAPLLVVNTLLIAATVLTGAHYGVDLLATAAMFAGSVLLWRRFALSPLPRPSHAANPESRIPNPEPLVPSPQSAYNPPHERVDDGLPPHAVDHFPSRGSGLPAPRGRVAQRR